MENVTKFLIIAASMLIVIILIAVSIRVLAPTNNIISQSETRSSVVSVTAFNSKFEKYFGQNVSSAIACTLVQNIYVSNSRNPSHFVRICLRDKNANKIIYAHDQTTEGELQKAIQDIYDYIKGNGHTSYAINVTPHCTYSRDNSGYDDGYIVCISIQEN